MTYSYIPFFSMLFGCYIRSYVVDVMICYMRVLFWTGVGGCCRKTVARPDNLVQASQSRLGEMDKDSPRPFVRERSLRRPAQFLSEQTSRPSEGGSPEPEPLAWVRPFSLSEGLGEAVWLCGCFWNPEMVYACLYVDYCVKCMRRMNMHEWCDSWMVNDGFGREPSHVKWMRWLVLNWHDIGMRWDSTMLVENDELVWIHWKNERDGLWGTSMWYVCINLYDGSVWIGWACLVCVSA